MYHEYFPEEFVQLQLELQHHPLLIQRLQKHTGINNEIGIIFAEICNYCGIAINSTLDGEQLEVLSKILTDKLKTLAVKSAISGLSDNWEKEAWKFGTHPSSTLH